MAKNANGVGKKIKKNTIVLFVVLGVLLLGILLLVIFRDAIVAEIKGRVCTFPGLKYIEIWLIKNLQYQLQLSGIRTEI